MAASSSSSCSRRYDVFPSFSGEDVRRGFLSYLLKEFDRRSINSFIDNGIERSRPIGPELISAIREARISVVIFSKNYAASTWCLNELVEIYKSYKELDQMVIPIFYYVDPSHVRKQIGEFGESFMKTCHGKTDDVKQRWTQALTDVSNLAGENLSNGPSEAHMVEKIANDVSNKLLPPSNGFGDFVGIEAHLGAIKSILYLESEEPRMIGIWGQSGIGKTTLGRALFSHLSTDFHFRNFTTDKPMDKDVSGTKLKWEKEFLSEILDQKDLKIENFGEVKKRLNSKKVLIVLDDVVNPEFLKTLVGKAEWFGSGSIIIVITQDSHLLKAHKIDLLYEVKIPDQDLALKMLCRSAFGGNSPPEGFKELAVEVAKVVGNLPLGLSVLGSSLRGRTIEEWKEFLPGLQTGIKGDIMKTLRVGYDRLDIKEQEIFLWIASLLNGKSVKSINDFFGDSKDGLKRLAEKSLIRITSEKKFNGMYRRRNEGIVEMHSLLEALGREIVRAESKGNPPGKRRFLTNHEEILDVFTNQTGTETVVGMFLNLVALESDISIDKKSFQGMSNLQFLHIIDYGISRLSKGLVYLPPKLKYLEWNHCPLKYLPSNFKAECLVELRMEWSKLEKLWEGTQQLGSLKTIVMSDSKYLKEIPDLSKAIHLERVDFKGCSKLKSFPSNLKWESLEYLNLIGCDCLKNFPHIRMQSLPHGIEICVYDCLWNKNLSGLDNLDCLRRFFPTKILPEQIFSLKVNHSTMEKLCEGVQPFLSLQKMNLSFSKKLKEIPDLSKATNLVELYLYYCISLVRLPSTIGNLQKLEKLEMIECKGLEVLPVDVNLSSLKILNLSGCSSLKKFPQLSHSIKILNLDNTAVEEVPCLMLPRLVKFSMRGCSSLKSFPQLSHSIEILSLDNTAIEEVPCLIEMLPRLILFSMCGCSGLTSFPQLPPSIEILYLDNTAIEEVPCSIKMVRRLTILSMSGCNKLKNISPNIFRLTGLEQVDFADCGDCVITVATMEDPYETTTEKINKVHKNNYSDWYFNFRNCLKLDRDARELIIQSSLKSTVILPGGEVPTYFKHRAFGNSLTVTLPNSSLSDQFLRFNVCAVVEPSGFSNELFVNFRYDGVFYSHSTRAAFSTWRTDHLVLCSFKFHPTRLPSKLDSKVVEFKIILGPRSVKEVGMRVLNVSTSLDDRDGRSSKTDVVETETSNNQMQMTSSEENFNQTCDQVVTDTVLIASNLWIDSMITEQQDSQLIILDPHWDQVRRPDLIWGSSSSKSSPNASSTSIFSCWGGLLQKKGKEKVR